MAKPAARSRLPDRIFRRLAGQNPRRGSAFNANGEKEVLGLWIEQTEGAKFCPGLDRGQSQRRNDILIAVVDGLKGFPEAITTVYPETIVQTCIVHLIRNSLAFVSWKDRRAIMPLARRQSTRLRSPILHGPGLRSLRRNGANATRQSASFGAAPGSMSCRSSPSLQGSEK